MYIIETHIVFLVSNLIQSIASVKHFFPIFLSADGNPLNPALLHKKGKARDRMSFEAGRYSVK
jgi:hypothetical protein